MPPLHFPCQLVIRLLYPVYVGPYFPKTAWADNRSLVYTRTLKDVHREGKKKRRRRTFSRVREREGKNTPSCEHLEASRHMDRTTNFRERELVYRRKIRPIVCRRRRVSQVRAAQRGTGRYSLLNCADVNPKERRPRRRSSRRESVLQARV